MSAVTTSSSVNQSGSDLSSSFGAAAETDRSGKSNFRFGKRITVDVGTTRVAVGSVGGKLSPRKNTVARRLLGKTRSKTARIAAFKERPRIENVSFVSRRFRRKSGNFLLRQLRKFGLRKMQKQIERVSLLQKRTRRRQSHDQKQIGRKFALYRVTPACFLDGNFPPGWKLH